MTKLTISGCLPATMDQLVAAGFDLSRPINRTWKSFGPGKDSQVYVQDAGFVPAKPKLTPEDRAERASVRATNQWARADLES